jgi:(p)ppGpp synthase/HD superfamily hydrolase
MIYSEKIKAAIRFATKTHEVYQKQKRKGKDIPYITHPLIVGVILAHAGAGEDVIVAGILHDTIEDSPAGKKVTRDMLCERFGEKVAGIVSDLTEPPKELSYDVRKGHSLQRIPNMSHDSLLVKTADIIANASELIQDFKDEGDKTFLRFNAPKEKALALYDRVTTSILQTWPENPLADDLKEVKRAQAQMQVPR